MADEPETTPIQNKYAQQYAGDLEANRKEQADVIEQVAGLQKRLEQLRVDETWLSQALGSLPAAVAPSENESEAGPAGAVEAPSAAETETPEPVEAVAGALQSVPQPRQDKPVKAAQLKQPAKKAVAKKTAVAKKATAKTPAAEVPAEEPEPGKKEKAGPPLHELILTILLKAPGEPHVAREVTDQLAQDHPTRATSVQTVRNNLETLVKREVVEKSQQQGSAMYTAFADAASAADAAVGGEAGETPETAAEKVLAEV